MSKPTVKYPRLHTIEQASVLLVTVAENDLTTDPIREVTYVCRMRNSLVDEDFEIIGELYNYSEEDEDE